VGLLENALKLKLLPQTSRLAKYIIAKDLTIRQREKNKKRREEIYTFTFRYIKNY
jgi:hypothetical protein